MKCLHGGSLINISSANTPSGSAIWNSYRKGFEFFIHHLYRVLGNGMRTLLWEDTISGKPPLSSVPQFSELMNWSKNKGLLPLADICSWDNDGNWIGWNFLDLPVRFIPQKTVMVSFLSGITPVHSSQKDRWGWGLDDFYSASKALNLLNQLISSISLLRFGNTYGIHPAL